MYSRNSAHLGGIVTAVTLSTLLFCHSISAEERNGASADGPSDSEAPPSGADLLVEKDETDIGKTTEKTDFPESDRDTTEQDTDTTALDTDTTAPDTDTDAPSTTTQEQLSDEDVATSFEGVILPGDNDSVATQLQLAPPLTPLIPIEATIVPAQKNLVKKSPPPPREQAPAPPAPHPKKQPIKFSTVSLSPQIGYTFYPKSEMEIRGFSATVEPRHGMIFKLHLDLGGDGMAFELAPIISLQFGGITPNSSIGDITLNEGFSSGNFQAVGLEMGLAYRFSIKQFFPHIGFGFHGTYLRGDEIKYGTEICGRIPVGLTVYLAKHIAVVTELGFMFGVTGIRAIPKLDGILGTMPQDLRDGLNNVDSEAEYEAWYSENHAEIDAWISDQRNELPEGYDGEQMAEDMVTSELAESIRFGKGFGLDFMIGVRFP